VTLLAFGNRYAEALRTFLLTRSERALLAAYELGREAVQTDVSVLDLVAAHNAAALGAFAATPPRDVVPVAEAAGDFLIESLAAFEMVQRGLTDARRAAFQQRRVMRMFSQLSIVLADVPVAANDRGSIAEIAQLVAEHARELTQADRAMVVFAATGLLPKITAVAEGEPLDAWSDVLGPRVDDDVAGSDAETAAAEIIHAAFVTHRGAKLGFIELSGASARFSDDDRGLVLQIAEMTAAALERGGVRGE